jgi:hypothetical protein
MAQAISLKKGCCRQKLGESVSPLVDVWHHSMNAGIIRLIRRGTSSGSNALRGNMNQTLRVPSPDEQQQAGLYRWLHRQICR